MIISSYPPRFCGIATFVEEAVEFMKKARPDTKIEIISHTDGAGEGVHPVIDLKDKRWYAGVAEKIRRLNPDAIHIEHEYGLYNYQGRDPRNREFIRLLDLIKDYPTVIEAHTIHGRLKESEEWFIKELLKRCTVLIVKCEYQKWRLYWTFKDNKKIKKLLGKVTVVPHGARPDRRYGDEEINLLKEELGLEELRGKHMAGMVGWVQYNKRWDIVINMWEEIEKAIYQKTKQHWLLFGAGDIRDEDDREEYSKYVMTLKGLEKKGIGKYFKFTPRGEIYYKVMAICDFIALTSVDETQSGTLARIIATNTPYITTAPLEGLTAQTVDSQGGLLFTDRDSLKDGIIKLACSEKLRRKFGDNLKKYLDTKVNWEIVARRYYEIHQKAIDAKTGRAQINFPPNL
ncbi:hypothetical protein COY52_07040 [Candidatus Desantisbacteria bacterium CG_4_10_14_0_8_um_filter_48_22]|uniref:Glycosyl transferase family 1 domain-containing protein n=1 Tax=Candidatus Desantisbacteria bacterium CG_4_10_14_0_8_um_filter_48_22 TaxID=1974543 RepID=A0A2M7SA70_9BACT|nr:MAG: hypothetical protein AUJ67_09810 [Candidatus Desantisbacteria bacterium CG1_02_49_89]PIZ16436.1 MAG: hypothetical protein COY52_07040 [Candidatus Desantisbacteria bacterium CG_4_10_14_0_8_um_filter_48_22]